MYHDVQYQEITTENWGQFISNRFDAGYVYVLRDFRISQPEGKEFYACLFFNNMSIGYVYGKGMLWRDYPAPTPMWFLEDDVFTISVYNPDALTEDFDVAIHYDYFPQPAGWIRRPLACFDVDDITPAVNQVVAFTDVSTHNPTSWVWLFGDVTQSTEQNPTHAYTVAGTYTVWLLASNAGGTNVMTLVITVS